MKMYNKIWEERQIKKGKKGSGDDQKLDIPNKLYGQIKNNKPHSLATKGFDFEELKPEDIKRENIKIKSEKHARAVLKHSGTFIFILSLATTIFILFPFIGIGTKKKSTQTKSVPTVNYEAEEEAKVIKEATSLGVDARFSIYVPRIDAKSKIIENVDMGNEKEYLEALKRGVAHGKGTYFPGQGKNIFLFSHSVSAPEYVQEYNAVFYNLKDVDIGDEIIIYFSGYKYIYTVFEKDIASAADVSFLTKDFGGETLILQTCDPPGTTLRRLLVIAELEDS